MPWILGGCGCLVLLLLIAAIASYAAYRAKKKVAEVASEMQSALASITPTPAASALKASSPRPAGTKTYTNVKDKLPAKLQPHFVAFSFDYPASFVLQPQGEINFVKVEQYTSAGPGNTSENFAVGSASFSMPSMPGGLDLFGSVLYDQLLDQLGQQFARGFHNYKEVKKVNETVSGIKCRAALFEADLNDSGKTMIYGKTIVVHPPGKDKGVTIIMLATSLDPDIDSPADLGVKGETAEILRSFRML